ncbi:putative vacuolar sorting-associated protein-like [Trypanosoma vivax]|uniref:Putative vacuolar sorting-associated protein-like n=1 Tax=Trypanosoma vivax (strain Y486) TaxID=1055687 RepID=G0UCN6_TRYVY|nr:putative vacuolar sorting-associated protein-like [Trypanosoma vivax]CCC53596.1 putative vacuolar sorting-associated protein-like [Trypanosoma vivax Y486]
MIQQKQLQEKERGPGLFSRLLRKMDGCDLKIVLSGKTEGDMVLIDNPRDNVSERFYYYSDSEPVAGCVNLSSKGSYRHNGILIELIGIITVTTDGDHKTEFLRQTKRLEADTLQGVASLEFEFTAVKEYESYRGMNARVSYFLRVTILRPVKNITEQLELWVGSVNNAMSDTQHDASCHRSYFRETVFGPQSTSMDVGVEDKLHIEFKYNKTVFHLRERVFGKVTFKLADMDISNGEISVVRQETVVSPLGSTEESHAETLQKFEIMDGTPIVGEVVPIRLYLSSIPNLTPTYKSVRKCMSVRYFLNLVLVTADGRRYFKQHEIMLYRRRGQEPPVLFPAAPVAVEAA